MSLPLTKRNALLLLDELERLIRETPEDEVSPEAFETASRLLASLQLAPGPPPLLQARLASLTGWVETAVAGEACPIVAREIRDTRRSERASFSDLREPVSPRGAGAPREVSAPKPPEADA
jgi:hypothetical protein